jgi:hypothetical protein
MTDPDNTTKPKSLYKRYLFVFSTMAVLIALAAGVMYIGKAFATESLRDGDIIFQTSQSSQSRAIQLATGSRYSHMGVIFHRNKKPYVLEAIGRVQYTPLKRWIKRGHKSRYVVKRLRNKNLSRKESIRLRREAEKFLRKPYDLYFGWGDSRIYCSELVWKAYYRALGIKVGPIKKLKTFKLTHPAVKAKIRQRYGKKIPLNEKVISPGDMYTATNLRTVNW